jgi:hypothetical protein
VHYRWRAAWLAFGREIAAAPDPEARRRELEEEMGAAQSVFPRRGVRRPRPRRPRRTRPVLCGWVQEIQASCGC